ncbi:MAG: sigma-70 family RNA polymerase sigma factor [Clostridiales bacterium]|nr:sigma-70 family RNA polymerase sigma factor [Clostridiales bacterium]
MTDKELEKIYNEAYKAVYWTAMALLKNEADAEDIVQDTFVTLIESYDSIKDKSKVMPWLKKIAANKCLDRIKLAKTDTVEDEFFEDVEAVPEDFLPDTIVESAEMRKIIMNIIEGSLSDDIRRTLILFYFDEMSTKEIAETLGVPEGTVRRRLNFARNKIKKEVEKYEEENKTKLFGMAALPFLSKLFIKEAEQVPFKAMPASLTTTLSASAQASTQGAGTKIAASATKKGTGIMINKVLIATIASVLVVGGVTAGVFIAVNNSKAKEESVEIAEPEFFEHEESEEVIVPNMSDNAEDFTQSEETEYSEDILDPYSYLNPDAMVLTGKPLVNGKEFAVSCTVGELEAAGFELSGNTVEYNQSYARYDDEDTDFSINCWFEDDYIESLSDDDVIIGYTISAGDSGFSFNGITLGMTETDFLAMMGTPARVFNQSDMGNEYFYLDEDGNMYRFSFIHYVNDSSEPTLIAVSTGTFELWSQW